MLASFEVCSLGKEVNLEMHILETDESSSIKLKFDNKSEKDVNIWKESNSWGYGRWRILVLQDNKVIGVIVQSADEDFTRNIPEYTTLQPHSALSVTLNLRDGRWSTVEGKAISLLPGETVIVLYTVPDSNESDKFNVWHGIVGDVVTVK